MVKNNMKKEKFVKILDLSSQVLFSFINKELLLEQKFQNTIFGGFNKSVHELAKKNKELIDTREKVQKSIDSYHLEKKEKNLILTITKIS